MQPGRGGGGGGGSASRATISATMGSGSVIVKACTNCSRRKTRCSGGTPCASCLKLGSVCDYLPPQRRGPKKRKSTSGPAAAAAGERLGLRSANNASAHASAHADALPDDYIASTGSLMSSTFSSEENTAEESHAVLLLGQMLSASRQANSDRRRVEGSRQKRASAHHAGPSTPTATRPRFQDPVSEPTSIEPYAGAATTASDQSSMMTTASASTHEEEFARRLYHVQRPDVQHFSRVARDMEPDGNAASHLNTPFSRLSPAANAALIEEAADQPEAQKLLYDIYWAFVHPLWPVLYRPAFDRDEIRQHEPALHYAILCVVGRFDVARQLQDAQTSGHKVVLSEIGEVFYQRALAHLDLNDVCGIRQIQALCLLSLREIAQGNTMAGWMHSGIALRAALGLQLNQNIGAKGAKGLAEAPAVSIRQQEHSRVIWVLYTLDKIVSLFQGRPYTLRSLDMDVPLPSHQESDEYGFWMDDARSILPQIAQRFVGIRSHSISTFNAWVRLMTILERVTDTVYKQPAQSTARNSSLPELHRNLERWSAEHDDLCRRGQRPTQCPVNVSMVMLWRAGIQLIMHRPFLPLADLYPTASVSKTSRELCEEAADAIVSVVRALDETFGIYRTPHSIVFLIFQAGIMQCITNALAENADAAARSAASLKECISWLDQMSAAYRFSPKYRQVLSQLAQLARGRTQQSATEVQPTQRGVPAELTSSEPNAEAVDDHWCLQSAEDHAESQANFFTTFLDSMWDIPLDLPLNTNDWSRWDSWQDEYAVVQDGFGSGTNAGTGDGGGGGPV